MSGVHSIQRSYQKKKKFSSYHVGELYTKEQSIHVSIVIPVSA